MDAHVTSSGIFGGRELRYRRVNRTGRRRCNLEEMREAGELYMEE